MLPNAFRGLEFDQPLEQERPPTIRARRKHLVLLDCGASRKGLRRDGSCDAALALLLFLASLAAVVACFVRAV